MKKQLFLIMMVIIPIVSRAYDAKINDYYYNLNLEEKTAELTYYHRNYSDNAHAYTGIINIPSEITYNGEKYKVTSIDSYTFNGCRSVTSVIIPSSVTRIGSGVFNLCSNLSNITIPSSVTKIGSEIFAQCDKISWVNITDLGAWCRCDFGVNNSYTPLYYAKHLYLNGVEVKDLVIPDDITSIGNNVFFYCESLNSIAIPGSVNEIGDYAFAGCNNITKVSISDGVKNIGKYAFRSCKNITSITIPNSVTSIGYNAFEGCSNLVSIDISDLTAWCKISFEERYAKNYNPLMTVQHLYLNGTEIKDLIIPNTLTSICNGAFRGYKGLISVVIPESVTTIGNSAFSECSSLTSVSIANSVTCIGESAFEGCKGLTSIDIPESVTTIGDGAFSGCKGLTSIDIPESVTTIGNSAFSGCSSFTNDLTIPNSITSIGYNAFYGCSGLTSIKVEWNRPLAGAAEAFDSDTKKNTPLYVPKGTAVMYMAAPGWSEFVNIQEYDNSADAHYITIRMGDGGVLKQSVEVGQTYTYAVSADEGWEVNTLTFDGKDMSSLLMDGQFSTPIITGNAELNVVFKEIGSSIKEMTSMTDVKVYASNSSITVTGAAENTIVAVYSLNGALVTSSVGNSTFSLESGVYIVKVGSETFKVRL